MLAEHVLDRLAHPDDLGAIRRQQHGGGAGHAVELGGEDLMRPAPRTERKQVPPTTSTDSLCGSCMRLAGRIV